MPYVWATCLPHKGGGVPLSALLKDTTNELAALPFHSRASFRPICLPYCVSKPLKRLSRLLFFLEFNSIFPARQVLALNGLLSIKVSFSLSPFWMSLTNPSRAIRQFLLRSIFLRLSALFGIPLFSTNLFPLASHLALLVGLNLPFLTGTLAWFF